MTVLELSGVGVVKGSRTRVDGLLFNKKQETNINYPEGEERHHVTLRDTTREVTLNNDPAQD